MSPNEDERQFCLFSGQKDHVSSNVDFSNMQRDESLDSDKNFHIPRDHASTPTPQERTSTPESHPWSC